MRAGDRIVFWWSGMIHVGEVTALHQENETVMVKCKTIDYDLLMVRDEDILKEEDDDNDG